MQNRDLNAFLEELNKMLEEENGTVVKEKGADYSKKCQDHLGAWFSGTKDMAWHWGHYNCEVVNRALIEGESVKQALIGNVQLLRRDHYGRVYANVDALCGSYRTEKESLDRWLTDGATLREGLCQMPEEERQRREDDGIPVGSVIQLKGKAEVFVVITKDPLWDDSIRYGILSKDLVCGNVSYNNINKRAEVLGKAEIIFSEDVKEPEILPEKYDVWIDSAAVKFQRIE